MDGGGFTFVGEVGTARLWIRWRGWHSSTLDPLERLAQLDFGSVREVGTAWTQLPACFSFCLLSQALQLKSTSTTLKVQVRMLHTQAHLWLVL
ncbi:unnamed protein product [Sphagnum jensenii]